MISTAKNNSILMKTVFQLCGKHLEEKYEFD